VRNTGPKTNREVRNRIQPDSQRKLYAPFPLVGSGIELLLAATVMTSYTILTGRTRGPQALASSVSRWRRLLSLRYSLPSLWIELKTGERAAATAARWYPLKKVPD
jgi:hypothetical protein